MCHKYNTSRNELSRLLFMHGIAVDSRSSSVRLTYNLVWLSTVLSGLLSSKQCAAVDWLLIWCRNDQDLAIYFCGTRLISVCFWCAQFILISHCHCKSLALFLLNGRQRSYLEILIQQRISPSGNARSCIRHRQ